MEAVKVRIFASAYNLPANIEVLVDGTRTTLLRDVHIGDTTVEVEGRTGLRSNAVPVELLSMQHPKTYMFKPTGDDHG